MEATRGGRSAFDLTDRTNSRTISNLINERYRNRSAKDRKTAAEAFNVTNKDGDEGREWTDFEMQAVLALICKRVHLEKGGALTFATALNEALNGKQGDGDDNMSDDIELHDVEVLLEWIYREKKGALAFIERQPARCLTRQATLVFARNLPFDGTEEEWLAGGRREGKKAGRLEKSRGNLQKTDKDGNGDGDRPRGFGPTGGSGGVLPRSTYDNDTQTSQIMVREFVGGFAASSEARQPQTPIDSDFSWSRPTPRSPIPGSGHAVIGGWAPTYSGANRSGPDNSLAGDPQGSSNRTNKERTWRN
ncbi:hypothetical protein QBC34DRAFT_465492 [Podospora aff. communis PSN243]|uniref:Uncharacterized protein n=1 Tax=Podospora aff. communis PSN243 TaxID=3040156 RepID=A0AAV9GKX5_9PEZI|nr:hypothetical protein QBC34DRAFT_465492 [Podospora aff. communis PSN243]